MFPLKSEDLLLDSLSAFPSTEHPNFTKVSLAHKQKIDITHLANSMKVQFAFYC
jgi:hypothetical protein